MRRSRFFSIVALAPLALLAGCGAILDIGELPDSDAGLPLDLTSKDAGHDAADANVRDGKVVLTKDADNAEDANDAATADEPDVGPPLDCTPGDTTTSDCGNCGKAKHTCTSEGKWVIEACANEGSCAIGTSKTCNAYGTSVCDSSCNYGSCSCPSAPACSPGSTCRAACNMITCNVCGQWPATCGGTCTRTYNYTGAAQSFAVPAGINYVTITAAGAQGGQSTYGPPGGLGSTVTATIAVTPGETLGIYVGGTASVGPLPGSADGAGLGGWNGGANGGGNWYHGSGGGGASDVRRAGGALADRIIVAGGGGGSADAVGGNGGAPNGANGEDGDGGKGFGATQSAGGAGGTGSGEAGKAGTLGSGGAGGNGYNNGGGGGGGGYFGGGGGGGYHSGGGGGGGSSYALPSATGMKMQAGSRSGNGQIVITYQ